MSFVFFCVTFYYVNMRMSVDVEKGDMASQLRLKDPADQLAVTVTSQIVPPELAGLQLARLPTYLPERLRSSAAFFS